MTRHLCAIVSSLLITAVILPCSPCFAQAKVTPDVAAGYAHSVALKFDGTVWTWGDNTYGQLGNGKNTNSTSPVQVNQLTNVVAVAAGFYHSLALKSDGTVWAWGQNTTGQLGNNTVVSSNIPVQMTGISNALAIAAGEGHSLVLTNSGLMAVGLNASGQIGDGTNVQRNTAVAVTPPLAAVNAIAAGRNHSLALLNNGQVWAWGDNSQGQLGNGLPLTNRTAPVQTTGLANIIQISSRDGTSLALQLGGGVWGWGLNDAGQVGDGTLNSPITPPGPSTINGYTATSVASGGFHSLAIASDGSLIGWGLNSTGQLGNTYEGIFTTATLLSLPQVSNVSKFSAGYIHTLGYLPNGSVVAFGANGSGQLGNGTTSASSVPVTVIGPNGIGFLNLLGVSDLAVTIVGGGVVTSSPAGSSCTVATCISTLAVGTAVTLTATPTAGNIFEGWSGACTGTGTCAITVNAGQVVTATFSGSGGTVSGTIPATGWWWNPAELGRGFMIEQRNGTLLMAVAVYEFSGRASWYASGPSAFGGGNYFGVLNLYGSGQTLTSAYVDPMTQVGGTFGNVSIDFTSTTSGTLTWPGGAIPIERWNFTGLAPTTPAAGTPQAGFWWNPSEPDRYFSLEIQNNTMQIVAYAFDTNGNPTWYFSRGPMSGTTTYQGNWVQYGYGQTITGNYNPPFITNENAGALTIQFSSPTSGVMTLPDGRQIPLTYFLF